MFTKSILAVSGALLTAVTAVPMAEPFRHQHHPQHKRDYVWVTETQEVVTTIPVTKTVWVTAGQAVPTAYSSSEDVEPAAYTPASSPPAYVAPVQSSPQSTSVAPSSTYVAPPAPYVAPAPTSTYVEPPAYSAPTPESTYVAPTTSTTAAAAAPSYASGSTDTSGSSSGVSGMAASGKTYTGDATYYAVGMGSCGMTSSEDEAVVAISHEIMSAYNGANPNKNPLCNTYISITGTDGTKYPAKIVDTCPGCDIGGIDLPVAYFNKITNHGDGRVSGIEWSFA